MEEALYGGSGWVYLVGGAGDGVWVDSRSASHYSGGLSGGDGAVWLQRMRLLGGSHDVRNCLMRKVPLRRPLARAPKAESGKRKQSTVGKSKINFPPLPDDGVLGFQHPDPPAMTVKAIAIIQNFRSGTLPSSMH